MKRKTRVFALLGIALVAASLSSCTKEDEAASLQGFVRNSAGVGLAEVTVTAGSVTGFTNASGYYEVTGLEPGPLLVTFSKNGYIDRFAGPSLSSGEKEQLNAELAVPGWLGTWFSGNFGANFSAGGPSVGNSDQNTDLDYNGNDLVTPNRADGILDLGPVIDLGSVDHVPSTGYQQSAKAFAGNAYAVRTAEGNYVKVRINALDAGNHEVHFDWYYQANGGTQF